MGQVKPSKEMKLATAAGLTPTQMKNAHAKFQFNTDRLLKFLSQDCFATEDSIQSAEAEDAIKDRFIVYLKAQGYEDAEEQFYDLLKFKSAANDNDKRQDGTVNWYHEFGPIIIFLSAIRQGKDKGGIDFADSLNRGGPSTVICSHLDHDRIEDTPITADQLFMKRLAQVQKRLARWANEGRPASPQRQAYEEMRAQRAVTNVELMTRKSAKFDERGLPVITDGKIEKIDLFPTTLDYMINFLESEDACVDAYIEKLLDGTTNVVTLFGTGRDPARIFKYLKERIDMLKSPHGMTDKAMEIWSEQAELLKTLDSLMGLGIYISMGVLKDVDGFDVPEEYQLNDLTKYLDDAFKIPIPRAFHPFYVLLDRLEKRAETEPKMRSFLDEKIYPQIGEYKNHKSLEFPVAPSARPQGKRRQP